MEDLLNLTTKKLLAAFGAGEPKPGSGSAAALQGLLSAQLIRTVIKITLQKQKYLQVFSELSKIDEEIQLRIYPQLERLFQQDSELFGEVISLRNAREKEFNYLKKQMIEQKLNDILLTCTETPIAIANLCAELANYGLTLFEKGYRAVRGDSGVAFTNANAAIGGCIAIINLNILTLKFDERLKQITIDVALLNKLYHELFSAGVKKLAVLKSEAERNIAYQQEVSVLSSGRWVGSTSSYKEIEKLARRVQNALWTHSYTITKSDPPEDLIKILNPDTVLKKILGYSYMELPTLGPHITDDGNVFEIAGTIDKEKKIVRVSQQFPVETQRFTAAHELGHALLHRQTLLHRDKPIDGSNIITKEPVELQADKFATYFLMPEKYVRKIFSQLFATDKFIVKEDFVFLLTNRSVGEFKRKHKTLRDLSKTIANAESYGGNVFRSMAKLFKVSTETMAIRLEELKLVKF